MNGLEQPLSAINTLAYDAHLSRQRRLLLLSGEQQWARQLIEHYLQTKTLSRVLWISGDDTSADRIVDNTATSVTVIPHTKAKHYLGTEIDLLVYDVYYGFNPNAVAALTGALCAGGLLVFILPPLKQWHKCIDPDYRRLIVHPFTPEQLSRRFIVWLKQSLLCAPARLLLEQHHAQCNVNATVNDPQPGSVSGVNQGVNQDANHVEAHQQRWNGCRTQDQLLAVQAIIKVARGHRRRPLIITSDRGRGKSTALGIASAQLMYTTEKSIVITAPNRNAVQAVFEHAARILNVVPTCQTSLRHQNAALTFVAPDELLKQQLSADLLLVDEAAAIPVAMLAAMLKGYSRVVFSTTEHGYEGTGRGFAIRFKQSLQQITPQWKSLSLHEPIRWAEHDPVERWLFEALLLDCHRVADSTVPALNLDQCVIEAVDRDALLQDHQSLRQLFGLLVNAHYQTTPNDLRNLLDGPNLLLWVTRLRGRVIAAALVAQEGGFESDLAQAIWRGQRRPQGHLLAQTLAVHCGWPQAPSMRYWRVMRIAVDPGYQRQGLGRQLQQVITHQARAAGVDMLGSSFAATADVMAFWRKLQCVPVRVGISKDACTGVPSALVLCALSVSAQHWLSEVRTRFVDQFCYALSSTYSELSADLVVQLLAEDQPALIPGRVMDQQDCLDVRAFSNGYRQFEVCSLPLHKLVCTALQTRRVSELLSDQHKVLLVNVVLQHHSFKHVAQLLSMTGKKQLIAQLREVVGQLLDNMPGDHVC